MQARACSPLCATADTVSPKAPQLIEHWRASVTESSSSTRSTWNISLQLLLVSGRKRNTERHTGAVARRAREQEPYASPYCSRSRALIFTSPRCWLVSQWLAARRRSSSDSFSGDMPRPLSRMVMRSRAAFRLCADVKHAAFLPRLKPVDEGVFHQRLQQHFEHRDPGSRSRDIIQRCDGARQSAPAGC